MQEEREVFQFGQRNRAHATLVLAHARRRNAEPLRDFVDRAVRFFARRAHQDSDDFELQDDCVRFHGNLPEDLLPKL